MGPKGLEFGSAWFDENVERGYRLVKTQSTPVFAFAHLLGIKLMPRIRHWKNLTFYRSDKQARYKHIDGLFQDAIDWDLIETHWQDLLQVAISIQAGKVYRPCCCASWETIAERTSCIWRRRRLDAWIAPYTY